MLRKLLLLLGIGFMLAGSAHAQAWSGILDSTRAIDWSTAGVIGGIPSGTWTQSGSVITASGGDRTSAIQTALNACGTNHYVLLGTGTFNFTNLTVPSNCELRGGGADQSKLNGTGSGNGISIGNSGVGPSTPSSQTSVTGGATVGSTSITVSSTAGMSIGMLFQISQLNNPPIITNITPNGTCGFCDGGFGFNGTRTSRQTAQITNISGSTVTFTPPLYIAYTLTPLVNFFSLGGTNEGIRDLQIIANNTGYSKMTFMNGCVSCWVTGIAGNYTDNDHLTIYYGIHDQVEKSYFSNAYVHSPGGSDSELNIAEATTASLVQNNIFDRLHVSIMLEWGPAGNVVAYNYATGGFDQAATNVVIGGVDEHGANPNMNLFEGNVLVQLYYDSVWGTSTYNTAFRNWTFGSDAACAPLTNGRNTVSSCTGGNRTFPFQASRSMDVSFTSSSDNFVGNVTGSVNQTSNVCYGSGCAGGVVNEVDWPTGRSYDSTLYEWSFGYDSAADGGGGGSDSTVAKSTAFQHGNYSNVLGTISWSGSVTHTLPSSFYLSSKPSWWTSTIPYPSIGPDVTTGTGEGGHVWSLTAGNPAQYCYTVVMGGSAGGPATPLTFNAATCYGPGDILPSPPGPPPSSPLVLAPSTPPPATVGTAYSFSAVALDGAPPYSWSGSGFPAGLLFSAAGVLSGTPTTAGNYSPTITVADTANATVSELLSLVVNPAAGVPPPPTSTFSLYSAPASLSLSAVSGFSVTASVIIHDSTCCPMPLTSVVADRSWLTVKPSNGQTAFTATVTASAANLPAGTYAGNIIATAGSNSDGTVNNSPFLIPITFVVVPLPLPPPVFVSISPTTSNVQVGTNQQFTAAVSNSSNTSVKWTSTIGTVSSTGLFTAPSVSGSGTITATSIADPTKSATSNIIVVPLSAIPVTCTWRNSNNQWQCNINTTNIPHGTPITVTVKAGLATGSANSTRP